MSAVDATAVDATAEARRILAVSISKLYASRSQRGGLRLHRSLLLSLVMRSARDIYHASRGAEEPPAAAAAAAAGLRPPVADGGAPEDKENRSPARSSRKRRGKAAAAPHFLPSKRARLEPGEERYAAPVGGCRAAAGRSLAALSLNRAVAAC